MFSYFSDQSLTEKNGMSATITVLNWLVLVSLSLLDFVPIIGVAVWATIYWLFGTKVETAPSIRSYTRLSLILACIITLCAGIIYAYTGGYLW